MSAALEPAIPASRGRRHLIALATITKRELRRILRIWPQTLVPPAITMSLYFAIFGTLIGARIGSVDGLPYIDYIVPGLVMMAVIQNAYGNISSSFFGAKFGRYVEEMLVAPMPPWVILLGYVVGGVARGLMVGVIVLIVAEFFTEIRIHHWAVTLSTFVLAATVFALAGFINAVYAKKFDDVAIVPTFVLVPLTYLGGVFYSISALPAFWQGLSAANPILYMVNAFRYGLTGTSDVSLGIAYAVMLGLTVVLTAIALWLLKRGVGLRS